MGGSYARYVAKHLSKVKFIVSLDSSFYPEFVPYVLNHKGPFEYYSNKVMFEGRNVITSLTFTNDPFVDTTENEWCYYNSFEASNIADNEYAFFYEEDPKLNPDEYRFREVKPRYFYIYSQRYNHTLHRLHKVANEIFNKTFTTCT
jgi:hypothetical protein